MKKILILGTGHPQNDLIMECKKKGLEVFACSYLHGGIGEANADKFGLVDIKDTESIYRYAKDNAIDYIYSVGSDIAMPTLTMVSERLGLPCFINNEIAVICNHKERLREKMNALPKWNIKSQVITNPNENIVLQFPFIMKPSNSQGQRGVCMIANRTDYDMNFDNTMSYSSEGKIIIEEYVSGKEISVNAFLIDGRVIFSEISDRITWEEFEGGIIHKHRVPSLFVQEFGEDIVQDLVKAVIDLLKLKNGPVYFQIMLSKNGPKLIEVTPRLDGCHMWRLLERYTGVNLMRCTVDFLVDGKIDFNVINTKKDKGQYITEFICLPPDSIFEKSVNEVCNAMYVEWYYNEGEKVKRMNGKMEKCGYCIKKLTEKTCNVRDEI